MKIVCISDSHHNHEKIEIPEADALIVAGDFTRFQNPRIQDYTEFNEWLGRQPVKHKIIVAGNHDTLFQINSSLARSLLSNATYLEDSGCQIEGVNFWGSPWISPIGQWAFMGNDEERKKKWDLIPEETDVLITHSPPATILDACGERWRREAIGCDFLFKRVFQVKPKIHVFGHAHESYGQGEVISGVLSVNAAQCDEYNILRNRPIVVEI